MGVTHLVNYGHFLLLTQVFIHHVHFWRTYHCFSEWNNGFGCGDLNFSKPLKKKERKKPSEISITDTTGISI